jgi:hypothetical protein
MTQGLAAMLCAALATGPAAAHDFWVQPARFWTAPQAQTALTLQAGHGTERQRSRLPLRRIMRFWAAGPDGATVDLLSGLKPGGADDGAVALPAEGTWVVALQTDDHAQSRQPAARFNAYAADEGLTPALDARRRAGRQTTEGSERYSRQAKALVRAGPGGGSAATRPLGLALEIVPEADPYATPRGQGLPVRVLYEGRPLAGALVKLTDLADDATPKEQHRTDRAGRAVFALPDRGDWVLNVVWTRALPPTEETDFATVFSSLSFGFPSGRAP